MLAYQLRDEVMPKPRASTPSARGSPRRRWPVPRPRRASAFHGARRRKEGRQHVRELNANGVTFVKIWVDDRDGSVPKLAPNVYRAIIDEAHSLGMEVLAHLSRTSALEDAKDLFTAGIDGFVHTVRDRDVDGEYLALVKAHPTVWTGPNIPSPGQTLDEVTLLAETLPAEQIDSCERPSRPGPRRTLAQRVLRAPLPQPEEDPRRRHGDRHGDRRHRRRVRRPRTNRRLHEVRSHRRRGARRRHWDQRENPRVGSDGGRWPPARRPASTCWTRTRWTTSPTRAGSRVSTCAARKSIGKACEPSGRVSRAEIVRPMIPTLLVSLDPPRTAGAPDRTAHVQDPRRNDDALRAVGAG